MSAPPTLVLTRRDVTALMDPEAWVHAVEAGFRAAAAGEAQSAMPMHLDGEGGAFHAKGATLRLDRAYAALKFNGNFPENPARRGLPTIQGAILLSDAETGSLLAIIDSIEVTLRRTAAATALAARYLARPDSESILVCGCGEQGAAQLEALRAVLPLSRCFAWDVDPEKAQAFARAARGIDVRAAADLGAAAAESDVIVTATTARAPFLGPQMVRRGTFVAAVGADSPSKSEIEPELMARSLVVADVLEQCATMGDLHHAIEAGAMRRQDVHAELAELVSGERPARPDASTITLFDSTGTALQDVAAAATLYARAIGRTEILSIDLGSA